MSHVVSIHHLHSCAPQPSFGWAFPETTIYDTLQEAIDAHEACVRKETTTLSVVRIHGLPLSCRADETSRVWKHSDDVLVEYIVRQTSQ